MNQPPNPIQAIYQEISKVRIVRPPTKLSPFNPVRIVSEQLERLPRKKKRQYLTALQGFSGESEKKKRKTNREKTFFEKVKSFQKELEHHRVGRMPVKEAIRSGFLFCSCGSNEFHQEKKELVCIHCRKVELMRHVATMPSRVHWKTKDSQFAERYRKIAERLQSNGYGSKDKRRILESYAFRYLPLNGDVPVSNDRRNGGMSELQLIKFMRHSFQTRQYLINQRGKE